MTIPMMPTSAYNLSNGIGKALQIIAERRREDEQRKLMTQQQQRQNDMQNLAIWQQVLPGLSQYNAPQQIPTGIEGMSLNPTIQTQEQFKAPTPTGPIAESLQRLTGQTNLGLSPEQMASMRENALKQYTFGDTLQGSKLNLQKSKQDLAKGALDMQGAQQQLDLGPAAASQKYIDQLAPGMINDVISRTGIEPTQKNISKIVDASWAQFQTGNAPGMIKQSANKEQFAAAVRALIQQREENSQQWGRIAASRDNSNNPQNELYKAISGVNSALGNLENESQTMIAKYPQIQYGIAVGPDSEKVVARFNEIERQKQALRVRQGELMNAQGNMLAPGMTPIPTGAMPTEGGNGVAQAASGQAGGTAALVANLEQTLRESPVMRSSTAKIAWLRAKIADGTLSKEQAQAIGQKFNLRF